MVHIAGSGSFIASSDRSGLRFRIAGSGHFTHLRIAVSLSHGSRYSRAHLGSCTHAAHVLCVYAHAVRFISLHVLHVPFTPHAHLVTHAHTLSATSRLDPHLDRIGLPPHLAVYTLALPGLPGFYIVLDRIFVLAPFTLIFARTTSLRLPLFTHVFSFFLVHWFVFCVCSHASLILHSFKLACCVCTRTLDSGSHAHTVYALVCTLRVYARCTGFVFAALRSARTLFGCRFLVLHFAHALRYAAHHTHARTHPLRFTVLCTFTHVCAFWIGCLAPHSHRSFWIADRTHVTLPHTFASVLRFLDRTGYALRLPLHWFTRSLWIAPGCTPLCLAFCLSFTGSRLLVCTRIAVLTRRIVAWLGLRS